MLDVALEGLLDLGAVGALGDRADEVLRGRHTVGMAVHVQADAGAEVVLADIALEHLQHAAAFLVGNAVESVLDGLVARDGFADLACGRQRVVAHCAERTL